MSQVKKFIFEKTQFDQIKKYNFGRNWPVVYLIENGTEAYIGETINAYVRSIQHWDNPERRKLKNIHIITDEEYNKSATLDIESSLIQFMSADGKFVLQNGNSGLSNHNYYDKPTYEAKLLDIWEELKTRGLASKSLNEIKNSELFKYSPYKALSDDQLIVVHELLFEIENSSTNTFIVNGGPGTGKTVLATYLIKLLKGLKETNNYTVALVVPMGALRKTIKKVFENVKGLSADMVIGPSEVTKKYDILIVDEAHRLSKRKNIVNYSGFDKTNKSLGLDNNGTQLDWVLRSSSKHILFYDKNQNVMPADVEHIHFSELENKKEYELQTQFRIGEGEDGERYMDFIRDTFDLKKSAKFSFEKYDFHIYDDINKMVSDIKIKDTKLGICRMVSGYAWPWVSRNNPEMHDIEINGLKLFWNSVNHNWVNSKNAINEVGCIHTVQGYDLNYAGVIIGPELAFENNHFVIHADKYMDRNGRRGVDDPKELERYILNIYTTLMTRGIKGTYVYAVDDKLREYLKSRIV